MFLLVVCVFWKLKREKTVKNLLHLYKNPSCKLYFTSLFFAFRFSILVFVLCCVLVCAWSVLEDLYLKTFGEEPPPPESCPHGDIYRLSLAIFWKFTVAKNHHALKTHKSIDLNSSFSILRKTVIMFGYKIRCLKYFLGIKQRSDFLPHLCLKIIFFWL